MMKQTALFVIVVGGCAVEDVESTSTQEVSGAKLCGQLAKSGGLCPDITEEAPSHLNILRQQQREVLRFTSTHWNEGDGALQIRGGGQIGPCQVEENGVIIDSVCTFATQEVLNASREVIYSQPAGIAVFHPDHGHWHQDQVANFVLRRDSLTGPIHGAATKVTYCLIDYDTGDNGLTQEKFYYDCNAELQGISVGFGDEYHHSTHGQSIDITTAPPGIYYLTHEADPTNKWLELDDSNNASWAKFELLRESGSGNGSIRWIENSPCTGLACGNTSNR